MAVPEVVAECVSAMKANVEIPVTVKCRIGIDAMESFEEFENFIRIVASAGCDTFIVHARKAWLQGLSPKQNREIPPLRYDYVHELKKNMPELSILINGGIKSIETVQQQLEYVDGVMLGREAYYNPYVLASVDKDIYGDESAVMKSRQDIVDEMCNYIDEQLAQGVILHSITRHMLGLFQGCRGARAWRRHLSEYGHLEGADSSVVKTALTYVL
jgi:tRNA-dihydrouridine synthase A